VDHRNVEKNLRGACAQDQATAALADYKKKLDDQSNALERGEDKIARLMEERNTLKRKVERLSAKGSIDTLLEEEVSTLRVSGVPSWFCI
jgi:polyhydroxyalkanoate synthesis regulator phasin